MADTGDNIHAIASYLGVKCGKITYDGPERIPVMKGKTGTRRGFVSIVKHLTRAAEKKLLIGEEAAEKAVVDQWLEYKVCHLDRCPSDKDKFIMLMDLDHYLKDKVYFLHHRLSLIDLALFYTLQPTFADLTFYDKQKLMHLSRWYNNVQQSPTIRQSFPAVTFSKVPLYSGSAH
ncbi:eukaryotic translation elongation factor 1 epsilon-1-like [Ruditapes philippinarum]|uniref:eukaryotic translation elongation factor 1 epsilon-1-like n=1 Tax=Ruditapes philippinarum TaxID=129788 RepID=UPI00295BCA69|nr:eukaryotic translation elongation factor 1 epsilon-1-like [Ruditapes philippinarum]